MEFLNERNRKKNNEKDVIFSFGIFTNNLYMEHIVTI